MAEATIGGQTVDLDDPCALYQLLYTAKLQRLAGEQVSEVELRTPVGQRRMVSVPAAAAELDAELRRLSRECERKLGRRSRYAICGRMTRPY
ncbi:UNVERIFIED_ORG: hypothetical protein GGE64_005238 [Rhizobium etli]